MTEKLTEAEYYNVFGLEPPQEGENEQEPAEPVQQEEEISADLAVELEGENEQEIADPANGEEQQDLEEPRPVEEEKGQSKEERRAQAAARRKREKEEEISRAVEKALQQEREKNKKEWDSFFSNSGLENSVTGEKIKNREDFHAWQEQYGRAKEEQEKNDLAEKLKYAGVDLETINAAIRQNPLVKEAASAVARAKEAEKRAAFEKARIEIDEQIREIGKIDQSIKSLEDLRALESYEQILSLVRRGNNILDAYKLANFDRLTTAAVEKSRQAAINAAKAKQHLAQTEIRGKGAEPVPQDVIAEYRFFNPDATDAEIQKHYNKYIKR